MSHACKLTNQSKMACGVPAHLQQQDLSGQGACIRCQSAEHAAASGAQLPPPPHQSLAADSPGPAHAF